MLLLFDKVTCKCFIYHKPFSYFICIFHVHDQAHVMVKWHCPGEHKNVCSPPGFSVHESLCIMHQGGNQVSPLKIIQGVRNYTDKILC